MSELSRRQFLGRTLRNTAGVGLLAAGLNVGKSGWEYLDQRSAWEEASRPNEEFLTRHAGRLSNLRLAASYAPEQWTIYEPPVPEAIDALHTVVRDMGIRDLRIGIRWSRAVNEAGEIDLANYRPVLDYCLNSDLDICFNAGPIRTFRWPEEHVPAAIAQRIELPPVDGTIHLNEPLVREGMAYLDRLLTTLKRDYGPSLSRVRTIQGENEPFYPLVSHRWRMGFDYLEALFNRLDEDFPDSNLLVSSAGRLNLNRVRDLFGLLLSRGDRYQGRLVSGFDYHYKTTRRQSTPVIRHLDPISFGVPLSPSLEQHIKDSRRLGFKIEVTEAQAEPFEKIQTPGNSAREFRYMLLRLMENVLDPDQPGVIRLWGVEELAKRMLRGTMTDEHRQILALIQAINAPSIQEKRA